MWSISSCSRAALVAASIVAAGSIVIAVERMPLPAFTLTAGDGTVVTSDRLVQPGSWALIYVAPDCAPCRAVLRSIDRDERKVPGRRLVIVVAGTMLTASSPKPLGIPACPARRGSPIPRTRFFSRSASRERRSSSACVHK